MALHRTLAEEQQLGGYEADGERSWNGSVVEGEDDSKVGMVPSPLMTTSLLGTPRRRPRKRRDSPGTLHFNRQCKKPKIDVGLAVHHKISRCTKPKIDVSLVHHVTSRSFDKEEKNQHSKLLEIDRKQQMQATKAMSTFKRYSQQISHYFLSMQLVHDMGRQAQQQQASLFPQKKEEPAPDMQSASTSHKNLTWSSKPWHVEETLGFSSHPRVLIEAQCPHRVFHANAAFYAARSVKYYEQADTLELAVMGLFGDLPVVLHPVLGTELEFYLLEAAAVNNRNNDSVQNPPPSAAQAVG